MDKESGSFVWDIRKETVNISKHGVDFVTAALVFLDKNRKLFTDSRHSDKEERYFCIGKVNREIITVRFTYRNEKIRIIGAGLWRKGKRYYETKNNG